MIIRCPGMHATSLMQQCFAVIAISLLLWTASGAVSSRGGIHSDLRVRIVRSAPPQSAHHVSPVPLAALDADGDGMPDAALRLSEVFRPDQPIAPFSTGNAAAPRLTGRQVTPPSGPPR